LTNRARQAPGRPASRPAKPILVHVLIRIRAWLASCQPGSVPFAAGQVDERGQQEDLLDQDARYARLFRIRFKATTDLQVQKPLTSYFPKGFPPPFILVAGPEVALHPCRSLMKRTPSSLAPVAFPKTWIVGKLEKAAPEVARLYTSLKKQLRRPSTCCFA